MAKTNHYLIQGGQLTKAQENTIVKQLLSARTNESQAERFYGGKKYPNNSDGLGRQLYPSVFIPPYNSGCKLKTILNQTPKTHIFSSNMYELEIIRLLSLLAPNNPVVTQITAIAHTRLKTTCFGNGDDGLGECFDTSLIVLRFLATTAVNNTRWIYDRISNYNKHKSDKKRPWYSKWYFWLCLSELPYDLVKGEIETYFNEVKPWLTTKSAVMNNDNDRLIHPVILCILRNLISKIPEYSYIRDISPFLSEKDGRLYFRIDHSAPRIL